MCSNKVQDLIKIGSLNAEGGIINSPLIFKKKHINKASQQAFQKLLASAHSKWNVASYPDDAISYEMGKNQDPPVAQMKTIIVQQLSS